MSFDKLLQEANGFEYDVDVEEAEEKRRLEFIERFPIKSIAHLKLDEYVQGTGKDNFSYWLEFKNVLFGIGGGNASKFGLYKASDGKYYTISGKKKVELSGEKLRAHFDDVKSGIVKALEYTNKNQISEISKLDIPVWNMVLLKILTIYYPEKFITVASPDLLIACALEMELQDILLEAENSIQINYECRRKLGTQTELVEWSYSKIGHFVWEKFFEDSRRNYYILGSKYGENSDVNVFPQMIENSVIATNFAGEIDLSELYSKTQREIVNFLKEAGEESKSYSALRHFLSLKPGDRIAIKADGSPKGKKGFLSIIGIAEVVEKDGRVYQHDPDGLGHVINVNYLKAPVYKEFEYGGYGRTIHNLSKQDHIKAIFRSEYEVVPLDHTGEFDLSTQVIDGQPVQYWVYSPGTNAKHWDEFYNHGIIALRWDELGDLQEYNSKKSIAYRLRELDGTKGSKSNNALANFQFSKVIAVGDVVFAKNGHSEFIGYGIVSSDYYFDQSREYYQSCRKVDWKKRGTWRQKDWPIVTKTLTNISRYTKYVKKIKELIGIDEYSNLEGSLNKENSFAHPLNTILYGPPGTGKTYNTVLRAAQIVESREVTSFQEAKEIFNRHLGGRIEFITFHQNYSYEDFIQGLRPDIENDGGLAFEKKDGVFKVISYKALQNLRESEKPGLSKKPFDKVLSNYLAPLIDGELEELEVPMQRVSFFITSVSPRSISFRNSKGNSIPRLSIQTLRKMYEAESTLDIQGMYSYYAPVLNQLLLLGKDSSSIGMPVARQNYVIVIDEINRANISRVFGELITLIEPDKRSGGSLPLKCKLPSGEDFVVPSNLYIIGTMNTADKSIALLDIALRRRFEFVAMYPEYSIPGFEIYDVDILLKINEEIIERKGYDFQIGHSYFMGENRELIPRMNKKVIPLLLEYFMNDKKEVEEILLKAGLKVEKGVWPLRITE